MKQNINRSSCPISSTLDILGDKWTLLIIRDVIFEQKTSYGEFLKSKEKIATNILANRLNLLESHGLITKKIAPGNKSKYIYSPTEKTIDLLPVLIEIILWGSKYIPDTYTQPENLLEEIIKNKNECIKEYTTKMK